MCLTGWGRALDIVFEGARIRAGGFEVLADATLPGCQITALIGPSGAGKSTLLAAIAGFAPLAAGRLLIGGQNMAELPPAQRPVSLVFQDHNLFEHLSIAANTALGLSADPRTKTAEARSRVAAALGRVGLADKAQSMPGELSGGQRQRVAIARALVNRPQVVFADEPTANLDNYSSGLVMDMFKELHKEGQTIIMVTHEPEYGRLAERLIRFDDGKIVGEELIDHGYHKN